MTEHQWVSSLHQSMRKKYDDIKIWKINDDYAGGVPDACYFGPASTLWVEYKYLVIPKRDSTIIDLTDKNRYLTALQQDWLTNLYLFNISHAVIVGSPEGGVVFPGNSWKTPITTKEFRSRVIPKNKIAEILHSEVTIKQPS